MRLGDRSRTYRLDGRKAAIRSGYLLGCRSEYHQFPLALHLASEPGAPGGSPIVADVPNSQLQQRDWHDVRVAEIGIVRLCLLLNGDLVSLPPSPAAIAPLRSQRTVGLRIEEDLQAVPVYLPPEIRQHGGHQLT